MGGERALGLENKFLLNLGVGKADTNLGLISMYMSHLQSFICFFPSAFVLNLLFCSAKVRQWSAAFLLSWGKSSAGAELHSEQWRTITMIYKEASGQYPAEEEKEVLIRER